MNLNSEESEAFLSSSSVLSCVLVPDKTSALGSQVFELHSLCVVCCALSMTTSNSNCCDHLGFAPETDAHFECFITQKVNILG